MSGIWWLALLAFVLPSHTEVLNVTDALFEEHKDSKLLLGFQASFCGEPCQKKDELLTEFEAKFGQSVRVGRVSHDQDLVIRFNIEVYPTVLYFREGSYYIYDGNNTLDTLVKFCAGDFQHYNPNPVPPALNLKSYVIPLNDSDFERKVMTRRGSYWVVMFSDSSSSEQKAIDVHYTELARAMKGKVRVAQMDKSKGKATFARFNIGQLPQLFVFRGGKRYGFPNDFVYEDMLSFAEGGFANLTAIDVAPLATTDDETSDVVVLSDATFDTTTNAMSSRGKTWFVEFYAPWCGHCKAIASTWEDVARELKAKMHVAKLDCVANKNTSERFDIPGFPTLLLFRGGKYWKYDGTLRTKEAFIEWALQDFSKKEGAPVPPPVGQPPPAPTFVDQLYGATSAFTAMWEYNQWAVLGLFGGGVLAGSGFTFYLYLLRFLLTTAVENNRVKPAHPSAKKAAEKKPAAKKAKKN